MNLRLTWTRCLVAIIAAGILSRVIHTGSILFDKYLGDALYAAMVYAILRVCGATKAVAIYAMIIMTTIELFQLTMIPAQMLASPQPVVRIYARLLGTEFSFRDLLAYAVGIGCIAVISHLLQSNQQHR